MDRTPTLDRRAFLTVTAAAGGGLLVGTCLGPLRASLAAADGSFEPNIWVRIDADDTVRVMLTQLEMGQGVMTAMPMLVGEELDVDWSTITTEWVGADSRYGAGFGGQQLTAGSNSIRAYWRPLREAGAAARQVLVAAAAAEWGVPTGDCATDKGRVRHQPTGRSLRYGALVDRASRLPVPREVTLKEPGAFTLLGREDVARLDIPEKVDGRAGFGIDVQRPDMLVARVLRCPVFGGRVASYDATRATAIPGVREVVPVSAGLAVVADNYWAASRGLQALADGVTWDEGPLAGLTTAEISRRFREKAEQPGAPARNDGDADAALGSAATTFERVFEVPYLAHATMEPMNCTAHVQADRCDVWAPTQGQTVTQRAAAAASGLSPDQVFVHPTYMGGGFGRRGEADFVTDAVETSKAAGRPVKVVWSREDDMQHDYYRPYTYVRMWAALDADGMPVAWKQRIVQPSLLERNRPGALAGTRGIDFISVDGAANLPYDIPNVRVEYTEFDPGIPFGFWRSVGASVNGYVVEAFFDEVAAAGGHDPVEDHVEDDLADARPREDDLGEDGAGEQAAESDPDERDGRKNGDLQRVAVDDRPRPQAECPGRADVVLPHDFEHRGPHHPGEIPDPPESDGERRQHQMQRLVGQIALVARAEHGKDVEMNREQQDRPDRHEKGGNRDGADGHETRDAVDPAVGTGRRKAADGNADKRGPAERGNGERDRVGQLLEQDDGDAAVAEHVGPEVSREHVADEDQELVDERLVEIHLGRVGGLYLRRGPGAEGDADRISGNRVQHHEQGQDGQKHDQH